jgi:uncharacterized protein YceH (UPF0502 family)
VLGCLLEKQRTTPGSYPLTLHALRMACNQSTNRDPVLDYDDEMIRDALHRLERRGFARLASGRTSRAPKYRHLLAEALPMSEAEQAVMCVLMLRGPQTPGELKQRAERMHEFAGLDAVHDTLGALIERGLAARLARRPGQKEERYAQLLEDRTEPRASDAPDLDGARSLEVPGGPRADLRSGPEGAAFADHTPVAGATAGDLPERVAALEREVAELRLALGVAASVGEPGGELNGESPASGDRASTPQIERDSAPQEWR